MTTVFDAIRELQKKTHRSDGFVKVDLMKLGKMTGTTPAKVYGILAEYKESGLIEMKQCKKNNYIRTLTPTEGFLSVLPDMVKP